MLVGASLTRTASVVRSSPSYDAAKLANSGLQEQAEASTTAQGYLLKQGVKGIRKAFRKRWFDLKNGILYYYVSTGSRAHKGLIDLKNCKFVVSHLQSVGLRC